VVAVRGLRCTQANRRGRGDAVVEAGAGQLRRCARYNRRMAHDTGYKLLLAHPEMVRDLLRDWVPGEWLAEADFSTLERINASDVTEREKERHDDMVWRLRLRDRWLWV